VCFTGYELAHKKQLHLIATGMCATVVGMCVYVIERERESAYERERHLIPTMGWLRSVGSIKL